MSKIAVRAGHNFSSPGASALIEETIEDRKVKDSFIKYLTTAGNQVLDVTPGNCDVNTDLSHGVNKANSWGADLFISIHFNKAYNKYNGAIGTEAWIYGYGGKAEPIAHRIVNNLSVKIGLINRGVKISTILYELRKTNMSAIIVEVCFVEATEDVRIYREKGYNFIGKCIAEAVANTTINDAPEQQPQTQIPVIRYQAQVENIGWQGWVKDGETAGTEGKSLRLEALAIDYQGSGNISLEGHVQDVGWQAIRHDGEVVGTVGEALRLEAIKINLDDKNYSIQYQVHVQDIGWMPLVSDGSVAGTVGQSKRIEAIRIKVVKR